MRIRVRTTQGNVFEIEVSHDDTVSRVKEKLVALKPSVFPYSEGMNVIYAGQICVDHKLILTDYEVKETGFLVATLPRKQATDSIKKAAKRPDAEAVRSPVSQATSASSSASQGISTFTPARVSTVSSAPPSHDPSCGVPNTTPFPAPVAADSAPNDNIGALLALLQHIAHINPRLHQRIQRHPQEFLHVLATIEQMPEDERTDVLNVLLDGDVNEILGVDEDDDMDGVGDMSDIADHVDEDTEAPMDPLPPLTKDELEAVSRLQSLGFSHEEALEAYVVCDKNENDAANFLLNFM